MDDVVRNTTDHLPQDISDIDWTAVQLTHWRVYRHSQRRGVSGINRSLELHRPARAGERTGEPMSYTKRLLDAELGQIDPHEEDRLIDEARQTYYQAADILEKANEANDNRPTDHLKKVEAMEEYMAAIGGDGWEEMTSKEWAKLMALTIHGLNGGELDRMEDAAAIHGFGPDHVVRTGEGVYSVLSIIEFAAGAEQEPVA